ncbi:MAG: hypothetical protein ACM3U2_00695 [Deltaproteobacteria bacterium]
MRRLIAILLGVALGSGGTFAAFRYHLVRTDKAFLFVPRQRSDWHDAYADIRGWTSHDWGSHRELSGDLIASGRGDLVTHSVADELFRGLFDSFREPPPGGQSPHAPRSR